MLSSKVSYIRVNKCLQVNLFLVDFPKKRILLKKVLKELTINLKIVQITILRRVEIQFKRTFEISVISEYFIKKYVNPITQTPDHT